MTLLKNKHRLPDSAFDPIFFNRTKHAISRFHCNAHQKYEDMAGTKEGSNCTVRNYVQVAVEARLILVWKGTGSFPQPFAPCTLNLNVHHVFTF